MVLVEIVSLADAFSARYDPFRRSGFYIIEGEDLLLEIWAKTCVTQCAAGCGFARCEFGASAFWERLNRID
jgi:hypothetical protein